MCRCDGNCSVMATPCSTGVLYPGALGHVKEDEFVNCCSWQQESCLLLISKDEKRL